MKLADITKNEIKKFIVDVLKDNDLNDNDINDETVLVGENGIFFDSVDVLELIVELENKYKIKVKDNDIIKEKFRTFISFYQFVLENIK